MAVPEVDGIALGMGLEEVFEPVAVEVHPAQPGILALGIPHGKPLGKLEVRRPAIGFLKEGLAGLVDQGLRHPIAVEIDGLGRHARNARGKEAQQTDHTGHVPGSPLKHPGSGPAHFPNRSRTLRVMRSTIGSRPRSPCDQSVEPQVNTVPPRV